MKIRLGNKVVEAEMRNGIPTVKAEVKRTVRPDGTVDVVVEVPCMTILGGTDGESDIQ